MTIDEFALSLEDLSDALEEAGVAFGSAGSSILMTAATAAAIKAQLRIAYRRRMRHERMKRRRRIGRARW